MSLQHVTVKRCEYGRHRVTLEKNKPNTVGARRAKSQESGESGVQPQGIR